MNINWPLITVLFVLSLPGIFIAVPRLIAFLIKDSSDALKKRFSQIAVVQTIVLTFIMCFAGALLSTKTGLNDPLLEGLLEGKAASFAITTIVWPTLVYSLIGIFVFCVLYYHLLAKNLFNDKDLATMHQMRMAMGLDGLVLYGGVVEEIVARWGLTNLGAFFLLLFVQQRTSWVVWIAIFFSAIVYSILQIPAYIAAGCTSSRRFIYASILLYAWEGCIFGFLFWHYGILSAILGHMLFHVVWFWYDKRYYYAN